MYPLTEDFSELGQFDLDRRSIQRLPLDYCTRHSVVVLGKIDGAGSEPITVGVAANDPEKVVADIKRKLRREVTPVHLNLFEINRALDYGFSRQLNAQASRGHILNLSSERATADSTPRALANDMLLLAVRHSASDIHLEVYPDDVDVRLRIDGVLHQTFTHISPANVSGVVNRLKVMTGLDITEHRHPQDGRLRATLIDGERHSDLDYRVNVLPGPGGEDIVLRLANSDDSVMSVEQLGMTPAIQERFLGLLSNPEGLILVTGPTGSGKTTTLYTALQQINDGTKKILTAEDPIEFFLPKVNQKQVMPNLSMGDLARAFMRQDPDVILIGEIRDHETASTAAKAAATGHVVLGTLHTGDSLGAVVRMRGLGVSSEDVADALACVISQRLVRRICPDCRQSVTPHPRHQARLGPLVEGIPTFEGAGCAECNGTGFRGRLGIYELLVTDERLQGLISESRPTPELRAYLRTTDFSSLVQSGLDKVSEGQTTLGELIRVIPYRNLATEITSRRIRTTSGLPDSAPKP
jgi:type II secretory ATPase GspE/PulE/Tfp pilus assembly ATPase PilB-like protein